MLNAGGMRLLAVNGKDTPLGASDVAFDVYAPDEGGSEERFLLIQNAPPGHIISLNAGTYQVVCKYGDANAVVRADIKVDPGKLTEATIFQNAARLTLKLVEQHGGEALANTAWTIADAERQERGRKASARSPRSCSPPATTPPWPSTTARSTSSTSPSPPATTATSKC